MKSKNLKFSLDKKQESAIIPLAFNRAPPTERVFNGTVAAVILARVLEQVDRHV